ncbi:uncharacterized protein J3R85_017594 [Psidium guajava]|nr:uncharacterized protein J3R85_017594 [Psidium guajava]
MGVVVGAGRILRVSRASGYIAWRLIKLLLQHGYTVKASPSAIQVR